MKKLLSIIAIMFLVGTMNAQAQEKKFSVYAVGFYNLENLFDTCHDVGHNDYEYLPDGRNKWTGMKYTHKLRNMARVLADMGTDKLPLVGCAAIGVSEVENAKCLTDLCEQEPLKRRNFQFVHIEGPDQRGVDCGLVYNPALFTVRDVKLVPYIYELQEDIEKGRATRGFLVVSGTLADEHLTIIVNHLPTVPCQRRWVPVVKLPKSRTVVSTIRSGTSTPAEQVRCRMAEHGTSSTRLFFPSHCSTCLASATSRR